MGPGKRAPEVSQMKITCPGCGAEIETETGEATFDGERTIEVPAVDPPADPPADAPAPPAPAPARSGNRFRK